MSFIKQIINLFWFLLLIIGLLGGVMCVIGTIGKICFEGKVNYSAEAWTFFIVMLPLLYTCLRNITNLKKPFDSTEKKKTYYSDRRQFEI